MGPRNVRPIIFFQTSLTYILFRIGQYILLQPVLAGRFYPAKVLGRSALRDVLVEWYNGNVYNENDVSAPARTVFTPLECIQAKYREPFHNYTAVSCLSLISAYISKF